MSAASRQKLRLNVAALISETTVGRVLVCIDDEALVEDLGSKVRGALAKSSIEGRLLRLTNRSGASLPSEERVGDVLRDGEEVVAVLTAEPQDAFARQQLNGGVGEIMSFARRSQKDDDRWNDGQVHRQPAIASNVCGTPRMQPNGPREVMVPRSPSGPREVMAFQPASGGEDSFCTALPSSPRGMVAAPTSSRPPGPAETFEEDLQDRKQDAVSLRARHPAGSDWSVEGLTPKLREYISTRFRDAGSTDAGNSFIAVTMQPRARAGTIPSQPIHFSVARVDIIEFERLCAAKTQENRVRADHFQRCREALKTLVDQGASESQYAPNMLPYRYRDGGEFSDLLSETDMPTFGHVEGFRPTILIDNSGMVGENLMFLRSALKRILYSFLVAKSKFNLLKFSPQGNPVAWANGMVPPTAQVLREAEEFLDILQPVRPNHSSKLLEGVQMALAHPEADVVYVLSSGLPKRCTLDAAVRTLRSMNIKNLPLHIVGVQCEPKAELELRRLAEDNHGSFRHKRFDRSSSNLSGLDTAVMATLCNDADDTHLTISGQLSILEIMLDEQERHTVDWLEEQKCANRLLLTTISQQAVPDADQARGIYQRAAINEVRKQMADSGSRLQELVDAHRANAPGHFSAAASLLPFPANGLGYAGPGAERRRVAAKAERRSASLPRGAGAAAAEAIRRPSVVNPWDRPGAVIKTSQIAGKTFPGAPRPRRPNSARPRPASASARR